MATRALRLALAGLILTALATPPVLGAPSSCAKHYQSTLDYLLTMKETCDDVTFKDCCQIAEGANLFSGTTDTGVYDITNVCSNGQQPFLSHAQSITVLQARCDMDTQSGGWMVILRRKSDVSSPLVNFTRTFAEYEHGFGDLNTEFWYGLKNIHCLTQRDDVELMIDLKQNDGSGRVTWTYQTFRVDGPETNYVLRIGGAERIEGTGSDRMAYHNGRPFSTIDRDNDAWRSGHCAATEAQGNGGGWWYNQCYGSALTRPHTGTYKIYWSGTYFPHVEMKIRPKNCQVS